MPQNQGFIIIYITYPDLKTARKIVETLIKKRLIACANFFPIESTYWWKEKIERAKEVVSIVKTKSGNWKKVQYAVKQLHPYDTPCIIKISVKANADFENWINKST